MLGFRFLLSLWLQVDPKPFFQLFVKDYVVLRIYYLDFILTDKLLDLLLHSWHLEELHELIYTREIN